MELAPLRILSSLIGGSKPSSPVPSPRKDSNAGASEEKKAASPDAPAAAELPRVEDAPSTAVNDGGVGESAAVRTDAPAVATGGNAAEKGLNDATTGASDKGKSPAAAREDSGSGAAFAELVNKGMTSETFDLTQNVKNNDQRPGVEAADEVSEIMAKEGVDFDEARLRLFRKRMIENNIDPDTGLPLDPKAVMTDPGTGGGGGDGGGKALRRQRSAAGVLRRQRSHIDRPAARTRSEEHVPKNVLPAQKPQQKPRANSGSNAIARLVEMGFSADDAAVALARARGNIDAAAVELLDGRLSNVTVNDGGRVGAQNTSRSPAPVHRQPQRTPPAHGASGDSRGPSASPQRPTNMPDTSFMNGDARVRTGTRNEDADFALALRLQQEYDAEARAAAERYHETLREAERRRDVPNVFSMPWSAPDGGSSSLAFSDGFHHDRLQNGYAPPPGTQGSISPSQSPYVDARVTPQMRPQSHTFSDRFDLTEYSAASQAPQRPPPTIRCFKCRGISRCPPGFDPRGAQPLQCPFCMSWNRITAPAQSAS